jgi:hypothetical protein
MVVVPERLASVAALSIEHNDERRGLFTGITRCPGSGLATGALDRSRLDRRIQQIVRDPEQRRLELDRIAARGMVARCPIRWRRSAR